MGKSIWIDETEKFLVEVLLRRVQDGERGENGFKKPVWKAVVAELNSKYSALLSKPITESQAKAQECSVCEQL